ATAAWVVDPSRRRSGRQLRDLACVCLAAISIAAVAGHAAAQTQRPIRVLVVSPPAGPSDVQARLLVPRMSEALGQTIVIDNRAGAGGTIATRLAAQAAPDGYTLLCNSSQYVVAPSLYKQPGYDPFKDFAPIINAGVSPNILFAHPSLAATTLQELIALGAKQKLSYGSAGAGSTPHLTGERLLKLLAKLDVTHIPYSSAAPAIQATAGGQVLIGITAMPPAVELIKSGKLRGIAVTSPARMPTLPEVATVAESGFPGYEDYTWIAFFAPAGTSKAIVQQLNQQIAAIVQLPETRKRLAVLGFDPVDNTPEQFAAYIKIEVAKWAKVIKESGAKVD
ncbi:MAG TPA: tripartite tricarboxylate transporter substrate binding protein, partial [Burkholderiales bacterium]|nr:tripartite tricarboxylate transporter substrate binding protein [Burkholderiales bacterium]